MTQNAAAGYAEIEQKRSNCSGFKRYRNYSAR